MSRLHCARDGQFVKRRGGTWYDGMYVHKGCAKIWEKKWKEAEEYARAHPSPAAQMVSMFPLAIAESMFSSFIAPIVSSIPEQPDRPERPTRKEWRSVVSK